MSPDFAQLYDDHAPALYAFLLNVTRNEADSRDALQEVFVKVAERPQRVEGIHDMRAFLIRLAHCAAIDAHRRRSTREAAHDRAAGESIALFAQADDPDTTAFRAALASALEELPAEQRAVVHLKLWEGLTFAEIAEALAIPPNTAASRYRYGLDKLQTLLRPLYEELR